MIIRCLIIERKIIKRIEYIKSAKLALKRNCSEIRVERQELLALSNANCKSCQTILVL